MVDTNPLSPSTGPLAINKTGPVRYMEDSALQASIRSTLAGITAEHGVALNVQYGNGQIAGIAVMKINNNWSVSQAFSKGPAGLGLQTGIVCQW